MQSLDPRIKNFLHSGTVIPAHPLALNESRELDEKRQRRLTRYYIASGAGGVAVGVHTTQFEIRKPAINLYEKVLALAAGEIDKANIGGPFIKVAGIVGPTESATREAELAVKYGYHLGLVGLGGLNNRSEPELISHVQAVSEIIPVFGFYLQPAVGGRVLSYDFWKKFAEIKNVHAIKVAAFNRYQTLDVVRAVCGSPRKDNIALYTGNDDNIVADLLTRYRFTINGRQVEKQFVGGLLGHWAVWTRRAVELLAEIKASLANADILPLEPAVHAGNFRELLTRGIEVTDMNEVIFDARNSFHGCIPGIHEVLRRQGLLGGTWCLDPNECLSPGQDQELDRIYNMYPHLTDDSFVKRFLETDKSLS
ncbi:dihydrodipicolinate synthase family protein [Flavitalea antarctica]